MSARFLKRIGCFHSDVDFGMATHLVPADVRVHIPDDLGRVLRLECCGVLDAEVGELPLRGGDGDAEGRDARERRGRVRQRRERAVAVLPN